MVSLALPKVPILPFSQTLIPSPNPNLPLRLRFSSISNPSSFSNSRPAIPLANSSLRTSLLRSPAPPTRGLASISCSAALSGSGGGDGGDGLDGGSGGGGDGGSSGGEMKAGSLVVGESEDGSDLDSDDVIILAVGGMSCSGCATSVKRILESQPQVSTATVYLEKETAVVWAAPEAKVTENWQQALGEMLANHLTTCGFKSSLRGQGQAA